MKRIRLGISSCLIGENVRYDGGHRLDPCLSKVLYSLACPVEWVPVCPEVGCGFPVPREPMRLAGDPVSPRLVTIETGIDHTDAMLVWAEKKLQELEGLGLSGFIFKSGSPSSGIRGVEVYSLLGKISDRNLLGLGKIPDRNLLGGELIGAGAGIFGAAFMGRFPLIPVEDEKGLREEAALRSFVGRVLAYNKAAG